MEKMIGMTRKRIWGLFSVLMSVAIWFWIMIAMPNFKGFEGPEASIARRYILLAFTILTLISIISGAITFRQTRGS